MQADWPVSELSFRTPHLQCINDLHAKMKLAKTVFNVYANTCSERSGENAQMGRLARTFAVLTRIIQARNSLKKTENSKVKN